MPSQAIVSRELADLLKLLAHPDRLRLIAELRSGEQDVTSLATALARNVDQILIGWLWGPALLRCATSPFCG